MKTIKEIIKGVQIWFENYNKKRFIRKELKAKFKKHQKRNDAYLNLLTESLFKASKIVKAEILAQESVKLESENKLLLADVKTVIEKHFEKKITHLKSENEILTNKVKSRDKQLKKKNPHNLNKI